MRKFVTRFCTSGVGISVVSVAAMVLMAGITSTGAARNAAIGAVPSVQEPGATVGHVDADEADSAGAELTSNICNGECHTMERVVQTRRAAFEWAQLIVDMGGRGAMATPEDFATIQQYLTRRYGFVQVNRASARELSAVLGLSSRDATAIVEHRKTNGRFADLAALLGVPGIDQELIKQQPEALRFN